MQIPIVNGIYTKGGEFRTSYPLNLIPVPKSTGISEGYLSPAHGIVANGSGRDRGGIEWRGAQYRVLGDDLCKIAQDGAATVIGAVGGSGQARFTYGFDHLAVASGAGLFLYDGATLRGVTDPDLGFVLDLEWIDGYYLTTDGEFLVVTELNDPFAVNPLKYGSSEADPDPINAVLRLRSEIYAVNRYTIEVFANVGGTGFPFSRITGAQVQKGAIGTDACCVFSDAIAFVGSGKNEAPSVYIGNNGGAVKIGTREIDQILAGYSEDELAVCKVEAMAENSAAFLIVHLLQETLVYDAGATAAMGQPIWFRLSSSVTGEGPWAARNLVWCYGRWNVGNPLADGLGYLSRDTAHHWGEQVRWEFTTPIIYNESRGAVMHEMEIVALPGWPAVGIEATVGTQYSLDGLEWSQERYIPAGNVGQRGKRLSWRMMGRMGQFRMQRFFGTSEAPLAMARLEARLEPLAY